MNMSSSGITPEFHFFDYWQVLQRRFTIAFTFFIVCWVSIILGTFLMQPVYKASTTLIVEGENANILNAGESTSDTANFNIFENYIETQIAVIKSDKIAGKVFEEFKLGDSSRYKKRAILGKSFSRKFERDIVIERLRDTRMIEISVYSPNAELAAKITNRLAEVYVQDNMMRRALTFIRNQRMASLNEDFLRLQSKLDSLSNIYGPKHPEMVALKDQIRAMSQRIDGGGSDQEALSDNQALLEGTLQKIQESSVLSSSKMNNIAVVDNADVPTEIAKPRRLLNIIAGFILGIIGGALLAFLVDYFDDSIKTEDDAKKYLGERVYLGPLMSETPGKFFSKTPPSVQGQFAHLMSISKASPSAEAYRLLRTRILWSLSQDKTMKDIAILSSIPSEGKTTVASNFAISLAQIGLKVLLVDTDVRKGGVHRAYGLANKKGLADYLTLKLSFNEVINPTQVSGLSVVACGKSDIDSSQLFNSPGMLKFIEEAKKHFDHVIYDTPPLTVISDAAIVLPKISAAILVMRSGVTKARLLRKGLSIVKESQAHLLGAVLNDCDSHENRVYSQYYHSYQSKS